jgi:hypothetical protein
MRSAGASTRCDCIRLNAAAKAKRRLNMLWMPSATVSQLCWALPFLYFPGNLLYQFKTFFQVLCDYTLVFFKLFCDLFLCKPKVLIVKKDFYVNFAPFPFEK